MYDNFSSPTVSAPLSSPLFIIQTPFLYDFVMTHGLEWPSLTAQWLPTKKELNDGNKVGAIGGVSQNVAEQHELLLGTHTTEGEQNYLMVATVNLPREDGVIDNRTGEHESGDAAREGEGEEEVAAQASKKLKMTEDNNKPSPKSTIIDGGIASNYNEEKVRYEPCDPVCEEATHVI